MRSDILPFMHRQHTFGEQVIDFFRTLELPEPLPAGVEALNPYIDSRVRDTVAAFYAAYFNDTHRRVFLIGINPGRLGAGVTGIAFADTDALRAWNVPNDVPETRELSAGFISQVVDGFGGPTEFYRRFFLTSICPLGFVKDGVNYNYYDDTAGMNMLLPYIQKTFAVQHGFGAAPVAVVLGKGKNYAAVAKMNDVHGWFETVVPLEHPRFIMQYRRASADSYVSRYIKTLSSLAPPA